MSRISLRRNALAVALLCAGLGTAAVAQTAGSTTSTPSSTGSTSAGTSATGKSSASASQLDRADRKFVEETAMHGMAEVELGKVAQQKASNDQVKKFGEKMVQDHSKANDQLKQVASAKGVQLPSALDKKHQGDLDKMQKLSGADFDREYMKHMVADHKKDVGKFEKVAKSAKDSDVKSFASSTLPTLQEHLQLAQTTNDAVKNEKRGTASTGSSTTSGSGTGTSATTSDYGSAKTPKKP